MKRLLLFLMLCALYECFPQPVDSVSISSLKLGIDLLQETNFITLKNKKIALLSNQAGRNTSGKLTAKVFASRDDIELKCILVPEHGFYTAVKAGKHVKDERLFGVPVYSLYGTSKMPQKKILNSVDAVVIDIQDIGVRSYTFLSTVYKTLQACAKNDIQVVVLDRPNPLGGLIVDGNTVDPGMESFVGIIPVSYVHGCTIGELAIMINEEGWLDNGIKCKLNVIKMENWSRQMVWEDTDMSWIPTSPHVPTVDAIRGLAMTGTFGELGMISIGIGTTLPFQYIGKPSLNIGPVLNEFDQSTEKGLELIPTRFQAFYGMYSGRQSNGILLKFPKSHDFRPYRAGIRLMMAVKQVHPDIFKISKVKKRSKQMFCKVTGTKNLFSAFFDNMPLEHVLDVANNGVDNFKKIRANYLLYD